MIHPRIDELLDNVDSRYALVIVAAKRARQINDYHHQLGEGTVRPCPAAPGRVPLEELLDHGPRGSLRGQAQVQVPEVVLPPWSRALPKGHNSGMARVLVGITGGIAAYKACDLVRLLVKGGHDVVPLVTPGADRFVRAETFFALARRSPAEDLVRPPERADLLVVAPLTANTLAKLAHGLADNLVAEAALAHRGPSCSPPR